MLFKLNDFNHAEIVFEMIQKDNTANKPMVTSKAFIEQQRKMQLAGLTKLLPSLA